jgi:hypothetical protein
MAKPLTGWKRSATSNTVLELIHARDVVLSLHVNTDLFRAWNAIGGRLSLHTA